MTADPSADSAQRVRGGAASIVRELNHAGVIAAADVHITARMVRMCGEPVSDLAQAGAALAVRAVRQGSTCLASSDLIDVTTECPDTVDLVPDDLVAAVRASPLATGSAGGPLRPLVVVDSVDGPLIYLQKYFQQEQSIRTALDDRAAGEPACSADEIADAVESIFGGGIDVAPRQKLAAAAAATRWTSVLTGGPGTGKTYTVARILGVLEQLSAARLHVAVCAPTGRAVAQLQASLDGLRRDVDPSAPAVHAVTVHGLLRWRPGSRPRYGRSARLPHDVVVVDETSMLSVTAMSHLIEAMRPDARLILVGDPHQLASVEAGAVLADLVEREPSGAALNPGISRFAAAADIGVMERPRLADGIVELTRNYRNRGSIPDVAAAVNAGDADRVLALIENDSDGAVRLVSPEDPGIRADVVAWGAALWEAARAGDTERALQVLDSHRVLCARREGRWGVQGWTRQIADWLSEEVGQAPSALSMTDLQPGIPILVTANDRYNKVFNGDCGVVVALPPDTPASESPLTVAFRRSEFSDPHTIPPARLAETMWAYAMTIHRSQGSQFGAVTVVLPPADSPLLTRELLYTAVTRAKTAVRIVATDDVLRAAVGRRVHRASGLRSTVTLT